MLAEIVKSGESVGKDRRGNSFGKRTIRRLGPHREGKLLFFLSFGNGVGTESGVEHKNTSNSQIL